MLFGIYCHSMGVPSFLIVLIMVLEDFEIWCFGEIILTCNCSKIFLMVNIGSWTC